MPKPSLKDWIKKRRAQMREKEREILRSKLFRKWIIATNFISLAIWGIGKLTGKDYEEYAVQWAWFALKLVACMRIIMPLMGFIISLFGGRS